MSSLSLIVFCNIYFIKIQNFEQWTTPALVANTLDLLDEEISQLKKNIKKITLCESTDPFMYGYPGIVKMSLDAIKKLNQNMIRCSVLIKGILPPVLADFKFSPLNEYGISIVSLTDSSHGFNRESCQVLIKLSNW